MGKYRYFAHLRYIEWQSFPKSVRIADKKFDTIKLVSKQQSQSAAVDVRIQHNINHMSNTVLCIYMLYIV